MKKYIRDQIRFAGGTNMGSSSSKMCKYSPIYNDPKNKTIQEALDSGEPVEIQKANNVMQKWLDDAGF